MAEAQGEMLMAALAIIALIACAAALLWRLWSALPKLLSSAGVSQTLGAAYIGASSALIAYNKYLIDHDRFPFAVPLVLMHAAFCSLASAALFVLRPSLFPSLTDPDRKVVVDRDLICKGAVPIGFFFAGQLVLSNTAYLHSSVSFLQMLKEANLALVYLLSLAFALEKFNWWSARMLLLVAIFTGMTIHGELNFSMKGFIIQGTSQCFECFKIVLQAMLLSSAGRKLDALTYVMLVMPICFMVLLTLLGVLHLVGPGQDILRTPHWADLVAWWPHLAANTLLAFTLNVVIALFVKQSSAIAFLLAGIVKDAMIVISAAVFLRETITPLQAVGFALQLGTITVYSLVKTFPDHFEQGVLQGLGAMLCGRDPQAAKKAAQEARDYGSVEGGERAS